MSPPKPDGARGLPPRLIANCAVGRAYDVPLEGMTDADLRGHCRALTMTPIDGFGGRSALARFPAFGLTATHLSVPRFYGLSHFGPAHDSSALTFGRPMSDDVTFVGQLRADQQRAVSAIQERFRGTEEDPFPRGGVVVLPCGFGKTVVAIHAAVALRRRCLVLVHKRDLMEQWCQRVRAFAPAASVGIVCQDRFDAEADIVVAMLQSVSRRDYALADFGLVVVDECHHLGAPVFHSAMTKLACAWVLGLSATPDRRDGLTPLLYHTLGTVVHRAERGFDRPMLVTSLVFDDVRSRPPGAVVLSSRGRPVYAAMLNALARDQARTRVLSEHVVRLHRAGRVVLVLADRITLLEAMRGHLASAGMGGDVVGLYVGRATDAERERCMRCDVVLSTMAMAREGMDQPRLNALVLATPTADVVQAIGRIQRTLDAPRPPLVIDATDPFSIWQCMARRRRRFFSNAGYTTQRAFVSTGIVLDANEAPCDLFQ